MSGKVNIFAGGFLVGGIIGGTLSIIFSNRKHKKDIHELTIQNEDLIEENKKLNDLRRKKNVKKAHEKTENAQMTSKPKKDEVNLKHTRVKLDDIPVKDPDEYHSEERIDYAKLSRQYHNGDFDQHFEGRVGPTDEEDDEDEDDDLVTEKDIHLITPQQFKDDFEYRDTETVTYYQLNDVLIDSAGHEILEQEMALGRECLEVINDTEARFLYVDNQYENKMYEVEINRDDTYDR